jgi:uncharacterized protein YqhQ
MMRGPREYAVAVRRASGDVVIQHNPLTPMGERSWWFRFPLVRGVFILFESLFIGVKALTYSAAQAVEEEEEELTPWQLTLTVVLAVALGVFLFIILPTWAAHLTSSYLSTFWQNLLEGVLRILIFLGYVVAISRMEDIRRVFQYHGAEHKTIFAYEAGEPLTVERVKKYTTLHPRCGTSFLLTVMVITIFLFSFFNYSSLWWRIASRLVLMPLVAGLAYEFIRYSGRHLDSPLIALLSRPGMWLQRLTTGEPDDSQLEVAIRALEAVLPSETLAGG